MKIALIKCAGSLNVGNEFINAGGKYVMEQTFPDAEFFEFEAYDSCIGHNYTHPSDALLKNDKDFIEKNCDLMVAFSGSIFSKYTADLLLELAKVKTKKVLIGAGAYQYNDYDKKLCKKLTSKYDYIFTRDDVTFSYFNGAENVISGLDLGFFAVDSLNMTEHKGDYSAVNIDMLEDNMKQNLKYKKKLSGLFKKCYMVENTTRKYSDLKDYVYFGYWDSLFKFFYNADYVVTNRVHTCVACIMGGTPFKYLGDDAGGELGRNTLFNKFDTILEKDKEYSKEEVAEIKNTAVKKKAEFLVLVKNSLV